MEEYKKLRYNPTQKNLLLVWDVESMGWRNISMNAVKRIVIGGSEFDWESSKVAAEDMHHAQIEEYEQFEAMISDTQYPRALYCMN